MAHRQPFVAHIQELRQRLIGVVFSLIIGSLIGYLIRDQLLAIIMAPLHQPLYYSAPTGGFNFLLSICLFFGFLIALPVAIYNSLKFLQPLFPTGSQRLITATTALSLVLMLLGISFAYTVSLPAALHFLAAFGSNQLRSLISTEAYFSFILVYLIGFAFIFQLPLLLLFINKISPLRPRQLLGYFPSIIVISFIAAALITPTPDPLNQTIMALPILLLYLLSVGLIWLVNRRSGRSSAR